MEETILTCEDCAEGILTAVYRAYEWRLPPDSVSIQAGTADLCLFASYLEVETKTELAQKVVNTVRRRFGEEVWEEISYAMAAGDERKGTAVYRTIAAGLSGRIRTRLTDGLGDEWIRIAFGGGGRISVCPDGTEGGCDRVSHAALCGSAAVGELRDRGYGSWDRRGTRRSKILVSRAPG